MNSPLPDELISAYLDGELEASERARVEQALRDDAQLRRMFDQFSALRTTLQALPKADPQEDATSWILRRAERQLLGGQSTPQSQGAGDAGMLPATPRSKTAHRGRFGLVIAASAAVLLLAVLLTPSVWQRHLARAPLGSATDDAAYAPNTEVKKLDVIREKSRALHREALERSSDFMSADLDDHVPRKDGAVPGERLSANKSSMAIMEDAAKPRMAGKRAYGDDEAKTVPLARAANVAADKPGKNRRKVVPPPAARGGQGMMGAEAPVPPAASARTAKPGPGRALAESGAMKKSGGAAGRFSGDAPPGEQMAESMPARPATRQVSPSKVAAAKSKSSPDANQLAMPRHAQTPLVLRATLSEKDQKADKKKDTVSTLKALLESKIKSRVVVTTFGVGRSLRQLPEVDLKHALPGGSLAAAPVVLVTGTRRQIERALDSLRQHPDVQLSMVDQPHILVPYFRALGLNVPVRRGQSNERLSAPDITSKLGQETQALGTHKALPPQRPEIETTPKKTVPPAAADGPQDDGSTKSDLSPRPAMVYIVFRVVAPAQPNAAGDSSPADRQPE